MKPHILVAGRPRCGKTTKALEIGRVLGVQVRSTDDLIGKGAWSNVSDEVSRWLDNPEPWIIEGVAAVRALRKWLTRHPKREEGLPLTALHWMRCPKAAVSPGQAALGKACETIWSEIRPEVLKRARPSGAFAFLHEEEA
jgi:DNA polymerase III delta prime subunit